LLLTILLSAVVIFDPAMAVIGAAIVTAVIVPAACTLVTMLALGGSNVQLGTETTAFLIGTGH
jgi:hypothetical protein